MAWEARQPEGMPKPANPYSPVVISGDHVYTAGQVAFGADGELVPGGIAEQTRQALANVAACLEAAGCSVGDVVKVNAFLTRRIGRSSRSRTPPGRPCKPACRPACSSRSRRSHTGPEPVRGAAPHPRRSLCSPGYTGSPVPRNRTARPAVLGASVRRPAAGQLPSRSSNALRRRVVVGVLVVLAIALITISFREGDSGPLTRAQDAGAAVLRPFQVAADRIAEPFEDAYRWADGLLSARSDADRLAEENQQLAQSQLALRENTRLRALLRFREGSRFPRDYSGLAAAVIGRPAGAFSQAINVAVGSNDGVRRNDPVVTEDGLVGLVTRVSGSTARVVLLTDEQSAVSALDVATSANGIVRHGRASRSTLVLDRVPKEAVVRVGDTIVTAGWQSPRLTSLYPRGIPIGRVTSVGQTDTDLYKQVLVEPFADFGSLDAVLVLVPTKRSS
jgi:rod shape-determining protein MreC